MEELTKLRMGNLNLFYRYFNTQVLCVLVVLYSGWCNMPVAIV